MVDKLNIIDTDNYNQDFEFSETKIYVEKYIELIDEYMLYVVENMIIQDDVYLSFLIQRLTIYQCKKALYYYIEFIGQISDVSLQHSYLQLNSKDATLFVYKKTIYDINNVFRKKFIQSNSDKQFLNSISNTIVLFNSTLFHLLQKERLKYSKKKSIINFSITRATSITNKLFTKNNYFLTDNKMELCLFVFRFFQTYDIDTIKYSNICEIFIKKISKYSENEMSDVKILLNEKLYNTSNNLEEMSALRYINWILYPL